MFGIAIGLRGAVRVGRVRHFHIAYKGLRACPICGTATSHYCGRSFAIVQTYGETARVLRFLPTLFAIEYALKRACANREGSYFKRMNRWDQFISAMEQERQLNLGHKPVILKKAKPLTGANLMFHIIRDSQ